jgi:hypothetical protein
LSDERAKLAAWVSERMIRGRTVPVLSAKVSVIPGQDDPAPTVLLEAVTVAGQRILVTFADDPVGS